MALGMVIVTYFVFPDSDIINPQHTMHGRADTCTEGNARKEMDDCFFLIHSEFRELSFPNSRIMESGRIDF